MEYNLFLDDIRNPIDASFYMNTNVSKLYRIDIHKWVIVRNYEEFVSFILKNGLPTIVSFDHDLGFEHYDMVSKNAEGWSEYYKDENHEKTGYDCCKWLIEYIQENDLSLPEILIHSQNTVGAENIQNLFKSYLNFKEKHGT